MSTTDQPSARRYLADHNPDALLAYNQALQVLEELLTTQIERNRNDDQRPDQPQITLQFEQPAVRQG